VPRAFPSLTPIGHRAWRRTREKSTRRVARAASRHNVSFIAAITIVKALLSWTRRLTEWIRASGGGVGLTKEAWAAAWVRSLCYACGRIPTPDATLSWQLRATLSEKETDGASYRIYGGLRDRINLGRLSVTLEVRTDGPGQQTWKTSTSAEDPPLPETLAASEEDAYHTAKRQVFRESAARLRETFITPHAQHPSFVKRDGTMTLPGGQPFDYQVRALKCCALALIDFGGHPAATRRDFEEYRRAPEISQVLDLIDAPVAPR
jgi:hypothetical protein